MKAASRSDVATLSHLPARHLYTAEDVSAMTQHAVSEYWLEQKAREEAIPALKVGRAWRWSDEDVEALITYCRRVPRQRKER